MKCDGLPHLGVSLEADNNFLGNAQRNGCTVHIGTYVRIYARHLLCMVFLCTV